MHCLLPVSYTHLDVYKRQVYEGRVVSQQQSRSTEKARSPNFVHSLRFPSSKQFPMFENITHNTHNFMTMFLKTKIFLKRETGTFKKSRSVPECVNVYGSMWNISHLH